VRSLVASLICSIAVAALACRRGDAPAVQMRPLFGPVIGSEVIAGRADAEDGHRIWVLAGDRSLVRIDLDRAGFSRSAIRVAATDVCWGLARLHDGSMWTLKGRQVVAQITEAGEVVKEWPLDVPHFGLFGGHDRLLYQPANFEPPAPVLFASTPGDTARTPWSTIASRPYKLARASVAALNMITCGAAGRGERPCWFPDEPAISLVSADGATRRVALPGLSTVSAEVLLTADNPARPVRDAYVDADGTIWILGSGAPTTAVDERPGGWILARYSTDGAPIGVHRLTEPARLIVRAEPGRAVLLTATGMIAEVRP
jgi:hypothetical protein